MIRSYALLAARLTPLAAAALLAACAGMGPKPTPMTCEQLAGMSVPASVIGLPTNGAQVASAVVVPAGGKAPKTFGDYCKVAGTISPIDPKAPNINFQIVMPAAWNHRVLMVGGGGFDGTVPNIAGNIYAGAVATPDPVGRGYAVFASDSGHAGASNDGSSENTRSLRRMPSTHSRRLAERVLAGTWAMSSGGSA